MLCNPSYQLADVHRIDRIYMIIKIMEEDSVFTFKLVKPVNPAW